MEELGDKLHPIIVNKNVVQMKEAFLRGIATTEEEKTEVILLFQIS
jgi:hypothetical protein